jgi:hypothetical protein
LLILLLIGCDCNFEEVLYYSSAGIFPVLLFAPLPPPYAWRIFDIYCFKLTPFPAVWGCMGGC